MKPFSLIVAVDQRNGIGKNGKLPWHVPEDLKHFKTVTTQTNDPDKTNAVIMGRKTWESIPEAFRPLTGRVNVVLTKNDSFVLPSSVLRADGLEQAFERLNGAYGGKLERVFVIGGARVFEEAMALPACERLFVTFLDQDFQCDVFFPSFTERFEPVRSTGSQKSGAVSYRFEEYRRTPRQTPSRPV